MRMLLRVVIFLLALARLNAQELGTSCEESACEEGLVCDQKYMTCEVCEDKTEHCEINRKHCENPRHKQMLADMCPATCGLCTPFEEPPCEDRLPWCAMNKKHCATPRYAKFLAESCAETCGHCTPESTESTPGDADRCGDNAYSGTNCEEFMRQGLCVNFAVNTLDFIKRQCGETCGLCATEDAEIDDKKPAVETKPTKPGPLAVAVEKVKTKKSRRNGGLISSSGSSDCRDTFVGKGSCQQFKNKGFCDKVKLYGLDHIQRHCARTCGLC